MKVVCLNVGNYLGLGSLYVNRLFSMVDRHLTIPFEFVEVTETDDDYPIGWFKKLSLLEMFDGEVLYLDLDVVITANIDHIVEFTRYDRSKIWARNDWSYPLPDLNNGREATINSSVMIWNGRKDMSGVTQKMLDETHGDQGIITQLFWPRGLGLLQNGSVQSYKYGVLNGEPLAPIVVMHGSPKNHEVHDGWMRDHWR